MKRVIRVGNAQAFWGDRPSAASELLAQQPDLDYLTMDYLAEVSMSILAVQRERDPAAGYPRDFVDVVRSLVDYWAAGGQCRLIVNAGGLNPIACAEACRQVLEKGGCPSLKIGIVSGDGVLPLLQHAEGHEREYRNLDDLRDLSTVQERLITANAYLGCQGIVDALRQGAHLVITGRVADPSMVVAACVHAFHWEMDDWQRLAGGTVAGHLLECGTQVSGGISTDWLSIPEPAAIGFPIAEIDAEGRCTITKSDVSGGRVTEETVKEQLVYEIGDPSAYLSPDVTVSFLELQVKEVAENRVHVSGAVGRPRSDFIKVSATYRDGYRAAGMLTIFGPHASEKAMRSGKSILERLARMGWTYRDQLVECLGSGGSIPLPPGTLPDSESFESILRIAVESESKDAVEAFSRELMSLVTAGAQGTTGYAEGRPRVHPVVRYWPCLVAAEQTRATVQLLETDDTMSRRVAAALWPPLPAPGFHRSDRVDQGWYTSLVPGPRRLIDIAYGRSGDKGTGANIGILARDPRDYEALIAWLTAGRVAEYFSGVDDIAVERFELPNLSGLNFLVRGILRRGIRNDVQGKALAQALLAMPLDDALIAPALDENE